MNNITRRHQITAGAALATIGAVLPWATARSGWVAVSATGLDMGDGYLTALLGALVAVAALGGDGGRINRLVIGAAAVVVGVVGVYAWWRTVDTGDVYVSAGAGLYMTISAAVIMLHGAARR